MQVALAIGGCFCNDLRYTAEAMGVVLTSISVTVTLDLAGEPLLATAATMHVACEASSGADPLAVVERAKATCMVSNSLQAGFPVTITH
jgi:organic hydroperoxide reductase OsmC/OhrA